MNHPMSDPPPRHPSRWREPAPGASRMRGIGANALGTTRQDDVIWFSVRCADVSVMIHGALPERWTNLFIDFRKRMRRIPLATRRELVRHMWRQFTELPTVEMHVMRPVTERSAYHSRSSSGARSSEPLPSTPDDQAGTPQFAACDSVTPDDMLRILYMVSRAVRRRTRWQW